MKPEKITNSTRSVKPFTRSVDSSRAASPTNPAGSTFFADSSRPTSPISPTRSWLDTSFKNLKSFISNNNYSGDTPSVQNENFVSAQNPSRTTSVPPTPLRKRPEALNNKPMEEKFNKGSNNEELINRIIYTAKDLDQNSGYVKTLNELIGLIITKETYPALVQDNTIPAMVDNIVKGNDNSVYVWYKDVFNFENTTGGHSPENYLAVLNSLKSKWDEQYTAQTTSSQQSVGSKEKGIPSTPSRLTKSEEQNKFYLRNDNRILQGQSGRENISQAPNRQRFDNRTTQGSSKNLNQKTSATFLNLITSSSQNETNISNTENSDETIELIATMAIESGLTSTEVTFLESRLTSNSLKALNGLFEIKRNKKITPILYNKLSIEILVIDILKKNNLETNHPLRLLFNNVSSEKYLDIIDELVEKLDKKFKEAADKKAEQKRIQESYPELTKQKKKEIIANFIRNGIPEEHIIGNFKKNNGNIVEVLYEEISALGYSALNITNKSDSKISSSQIITRYSRKEEDGKFKVRIWKSKSKNKEEFTNKPEDLVRIYEGFVKINNDNQLIKHGRGKETHGGLTYEGNWNSGKKDGQFSITYPNKNVKVIKYDNDVEVKEPEVNGGVGVGVIL